MPEKFIVTEKAQRPAKMDGRCFYCDKKIGEEHDSKCVLIKKRIKVRAVIEYQTEMPARWGKREFESHRNDGGWCGSNIIGDLEMHKEKYAKHCMCGDVECQYIKTMSEPFLEE